MHQLAVGEASDPRHPLVPRVVVPEIFALQFLAPLAAPVGRGKQNADVVLGAFAHQQGAAHRSQGVVDPGRGGRPQGTVQGGVMQRRQHARKCLPCTHSAAAFLASEASPSAHDVERFVCLLPTLFPVGVPAAQAHCPTSSIAIRSLFEPKPSKPNRP